MNRNAHRQAILDAVIDHLIEHFRLQQTFGTEYWHGGSCRNCTDQRQRDGGEPKEVMCAVGALYPDDIRSKANAGAVEYADLIHVGGIYTRFARKIDEVFVHLPKMEWHNYPEQHQVAFRDLLQSIQSMHDGAASPIRYENNGNCTEFRFWRLVSVLESMRESIKTELTGEVRYRDVLPWKLNGDFSSFDEHLNKFARNADTFCTNL